MQLTKKDLITKLIDAARKAGNANPFALGFIAFDDLRMKIPVKWHDKWQVRRIILQPYDIVQVIQSGTAQTKPAACV